MESALVFGKSLYCIKVPIEYRACIDRAERAPDQPILVCGKILVLYVVEQREAEKQPFAAFRFELLNRKPLHRQLHGCICSGPVSRMLQHVTDHNSIPVNGVENGECDQPALPVESKKSAHLRFVMQHQRTNKESGFTFAKRARSFPGLRHRLHVFDGHRA